MLLMVFELLEFYFVVFGWLYGDGKVDLMIVFFFFIDEVEVCLGDLMFVDLC